MISNRNGAVVSVVGVDGNGHGHGWMAVLNAAGRIAAAMGADPSEQANGWVDDTGAQLRFGGRDSESMRAGDAVIAVFNTR